MDKPNVQQMKDPKVEELRQYLEGTRSGKYVRFGSLSVDNGQLEGITKIAVVDAWKRPVSLFATLSREGTITPKAVYQGDGDTILEGYVHFVLEEPSAQALVVIFPHSYYSFQGKIPCEPGTKGDLEKVYQKGVPVIRLPSSCSKSDNPEVQVVNLRKVKKKGLFGRKHKAEFELDSYSITGKNIGNKVVRKELEW